MENIHVTVSGILGTAVVMFAAGYLALADKLVSDEEVRTIVKVESPYNEDKKDIQGRLQRLEAREAKVDDIDKRVERIEGGIQIILRREYGMDLPKQTEVIGP